MNPRPLDPQLPAGNHPACHLPRSAHTRQSTDVRRNPAGYRAVAVPLCCTSPSPARSNRRRRERRAVAGGVDDQVAVERASPHHEDQPPNERPRLLHYAVEEELLDRQSSGFCPAVWSSGGVSMTGTGSRPIFSAIRVSSTSCAPRWPCTCATSCRVALTSWNVASERLSAAAAFAPGPVHCGQ